MQILGQMIPPKPFIGFTIVFWIIFVIDVVNAWSVLETVNTEMLNRQNDDLTPAQLEEERQIAEFTRYSMLGFYVIVAGFLVSVWSFITYRTSKIARWLYVGWVALGLAAFPFGLADLQKTSEFFLSIASVGLGCFAAFLLFRPTARAWFKAGGEPVGAEVFE
ncbi:MAG: hypothetical protein AAGL10_06185 [Pseudomonadota bacterium]